MQLRLVLIIFVAIMATREARAVFYLGGNGDGSDVTTLSSTTLDNINLAIIYRSGNGDGFDTAMLDNTTLSGQSLTVLYGSQGSGLGDGFAVNQRSNTTLNNTNLTVLFNGLSNGTAIGDGFAVGSVAGYALDGQDLSVLFNGLSNGTANGDGFAVNQRSNTTLDNTNLTALYQGRNGDGFDVETRSSYTLNGQSIAVLYRGGNGDGFDLGFEPVIMVSEPKDSDGDGIPNSFEDAYASLDSDNPNDALQDFDGDGFTNLEEYLADTNPEDSTSFFAVNIRANGADYELYFDSTVSRFYRFEDSNDLETWNETRPWIQGTNGESTRTLSPGTLRFGRIRVRAQ